MQFIVELGNNLEYSRIYSVGGDLFIGGLHGTD